MEITENNPAISANEQFERIIDLALTDGILTDKEREVIMKKAQTLGIDTDEAEMILEAKLFDLNNKVKINTNTKNTYRQDEIFTEYSTYETKYNRIAGENYSIHEVMNFRKNKVNISDQEKKEFEKKKKEIKAKKINDYFKSIEYKDKTEQMTMLNFIFRLCSKKDNLYGYVSPILVSNGKAILNSIFSTVNPQNLPDAIGTIEILVKMYPDDADALPKELEELISSKITRLIDGISINNESDVLMVLDFLMLLLPNKAKKINEYETAAISKIKDIIEEIKEKYGDSECIKRKIESIKDQFNNIVKLYKDQVKLEKKYARKLKKYKFLKTLLVIAMIIIAVVILLAAFFVGRWIWGNGSEAKLFGQIVRGTIIFYVCGAILGFPIAFLIIGVQEYGFDYFIKRPAEEKIIDARKYIPLFTLKA